MVELNMDQCVNGMSVEKYFMNEINLDDINGNKKCRLVPAYKLHKVNGYTLDKDKENVSISSRSRSIQKASSRHKTNKQLLQLKNCTENVKALVQLSKPMSMVSKSSIDDIERILTDTFNGKQKRKKSSVGETDENIQISKRRSMKGNKDNTEVVKKKDTRTSKRKSDKETEAISLEDKESQSTNPQNTDSSHEAKYQERCQRIRKTRTSIEEKKSGKPQVDDGENEILQVIDENCNLSMMLRPRPRKAYKWKIDCDDDDESWSIDFENKKKKSLKKFGQKNKQKAVKEKKAKEDKCVSKVNKDKQNNGKVKEKQIGKRTRKPKKSKENPQEINIEELEVHKKPEDCLVTAKRGTLKYLKQRKEYVKALAKDAECEVDFFADEGFGKGTQLEKLLSMDDCRSLTIKTPDSKSSSQDDGVLTPRTNLLGQWGVTKECFMAYTPPAQSPELDDTERGGIIETLYHKLKDQEKRSRVRKSDENKNSYESILKNPQKPSDLELPELPADPDLDIDDSSSDDYFEVSECF